MSMRTLLLVSAFLVGMCVFSTAKPAKPILAFCRVVWLFGVSCTEVDMVIETQIKAMDQYQLIAASSVLIEANHTSIDGQVENLNFTMLPTVLGVGCRVGGFSIFESWFSLLDNGTNYCNLYNVIYGSGLTTAPGFSEYTNEWMCLGYGNASCTI